MNRSLLGLLAFASAAATAGLVALAGACASGSSDGASYDGGDDSATDSALDEGGGSSGGEGGHPEGGGTSLTQACIDNASHYCSQLQMCSQFLLQSQYGDPVTCQTQLSGTYCTNIVSAKGSGWTGDGLEACIAARDKLSCTDFFYGKPQPPACRPTGTITNGACLYDSQCGTGYCRIAAGSPCGNCVQLGNTGAACVTTNDCDGNLVCANSACAAPVPIGGACITTTQCQSGAVCLPGQTPDGGAAGKCIQPGAVGATCDADAGGIDCDYALGAYCAGGMCGAITVAMSASLCGGSPPSVCFASGSCQGGFCVPPTPDGQPCGDGGPGCTIPSTCNSGTCGTPSASMCH